MAATTPSPKKLHKVTEDDLQDMRNWVVYLRHYPNPSRFPRAYIDWCLFISDKYTWKALGEAAQELHKDNLKLLCQDCSRPLFRWFLSRIDSRRILKEMFG